MEYTGQGGLYFLLLGFGFPIFSSFEAAAAFCVARLVVAEWMPGSGLQLPLLPGFLPGAGSKPGQHGLFLLADLLADFFAVVMLLLEVQEASADVCRRHYLVGCVV